MTEKNSLVCVCNHLITCIIKRLIGLKTIEFKTISFYEMT